MFNFYKISTLKLGKIKYFEKFKNSEKIENKLGLSWAKLSLSWGLKLEFEVEVELQIVIVA